MLCRNLLGIGLLTSGLVFAQSTASKATDPDIQTKAKDRSFLEMAYSAGRTEVAQGQLALERSQNGQVREFAKMLIDDHTKVNQELKRVADERGVTVATFTGKPPYSSRQEAAKDVESREARVQNSHLATLSGPEFDRAFLGQQVKAHEQAIALFEKESKSNDSEISALATQTLPTLQKHLERARELAAYNVSD